MLELGLKVFVSYVAGSLSGALLIGRLYGGVDIRKMGSGNAGGTNALRTQGKLFAFLVMVIDIAKGVLPVLLLPAWIIPGVGEDPQVARAWLTYACAGAAVFGHCYPVWHGFAGGKGAATALGVLAVLAPAATLVALVVWFLTLFIAGYVGLATILAAASMPVAVLLLGLAANEGLLFFTMLLAGFITFTHRSNIYRLLSGQARPDVASSLLHRAR